MSITKFKARPGEDWTQDIKPVECERETDQSVWIDGRRHSKQSGYFCYFDTWESAHAAMLLNREDAVDHARRQLELANSRLGNVKGMKPPKA